MTKATIIMKGQVLEIEHKFDDMVKIIGGPQSGIIGVVLKENEIGDVEAAAIAGAIGSNPTLRSLDLSGNNIGNDGARAILEAGNKHKSLEVIDLSGNRIDDPALIEKIELFNKGHRVKPSTTTRPTTEAIGTLHGAFKDFGKGGDCHS